jgi:ABC-type nitrate/sulfonate/bicarbonate transport system, permease component
MYIIKKGVTVRNFIFSFTVTMRLSTNTASFLTIAEIISEGVGSINEDILKRSGNTCHRTNITINDKILGFLIAIIIGISLAILIFAFKILRYSIYPLIVILYSTPRIGIAPIIIWFGYGLLGLVTIVALTAFFPILINTLVGFENVQPELIELIRTMTNSRLKEFLNIRLPSSLPFIFAGLKTGMTQAAIGAIVAEFIAGQAGLGFIINIGQYTLSTTNMFAALLILVLASLALYSSISFIERFLIPWKKAGEYVVSE